MSKRAFIYHLEQDFERWPLPISFDPYREQMLLLRRRRTIEAFTDRFFSFWKIDTYNGKALKID
jgi:hypothetical protein